ncbi:MAG: hypothetical protein JW959_11020 [Pirellulales bacterium]|nr:hypothetical protein [Pirellulales bacterium]
MCIDPTVVRAVDIQLRQVYHNRKAEAASGVSPPDGEDHESDQRDADGRLLYDVPTRRKSSPGATQPRKTKDHRNQSGNLLDETG